MNNKTIFEDLGDYTYKSDKKICTKVYNGLNEDNLSNIVVDNGRFGFELTSSDCVFNNDIYKGIKKGISKRYNLIYLFD